MPLIKTNTNNPIRGYLKPNANQRLDCQTVINQLVFADMGRQPGTLHIYGVARLDVQNPPPNAVNLQVQIASSTSSATALIDNSLLNITDPINQTGVANGAISVLQQSLDTGTVWQLSGSIP